MYYVGYKRYGSIGANANTDIQYIFQYIYIYYGLNVVSNTWDKDI